MAGSHEPCFAQQRQTLRLLSFNIHHGRGYDDEIDLTRIAKTIRASGAELVALQEVDRHTGRSRQVDQLRELGKLTEMQTAFGKAIEFDGGEYGVAFLSRWKIASSRTHELPGMANHERRVALEIMLATPELPNTVFVCTHFDHQSADERLKQATELTSLFGGGPSQAIIAGDLNAQPNEAAMDQLRKTWRPCDDRLVPPCPARDPTLKIDYVLVQLNDVWQVESATVLDDDTSSDHRPILAVLSAARP